MKAATNSRLKGKVNLSLKKKKGRNMALKNSYTVAEKCSHCCGNPAYRRRSSIDNEMTWIQVFRFLLAKRETRDCLEASARAWNDK